MCGEIPPPFPVVIKVLRTLRVQGSSTEEVESCVMELMDQQVFLELRSNAAVRQRVAACGGGGSSPSAPAGLVGKRKEACAKLFGKPCRT